MTMVMAERIMSASQFKAKCLAVLDEVASSGTTVVVTKRGKAVARVVPAKAPPSLRGSVQVLVSDDEFIAPLDEVWDVEQE
jgi:prevent-host-death family protein